MQYIKVTTTKTHKQTKQEKEQMPITPVFDELCNENVFTDNEMQDALKKVTLISRLKKSGLGKRSGDSIDAIINCLCIWPLLARDTINAFCGKFIECYLEGRVGVLYAFMRRQDINWKKHAATTSREIIQTQQLCSDTDASLVVDDTIQHRRGKGVEGASSHFDHTLRKHVMGHQMLQLVLSTDKGVIPVNQQLYVSEKRAQLKELEFKDGRSAVARDYKIAVECNKNEMFRKMLDSAVKDGIKPAHVLGDSWFGNKQNIDAVLSHGMTAIFAMQRGRLKFRFQNKMYTAKMLFELISRRMTPCGGKRFLAYSLCVEVNLEASSSKEARWRKVKLLFSKERKNTNGSWIVLLCTDTSYTNEKIIQVYARRWGVEVYFKEVKQNMGLLSEKSPDYAVHYASIHLTAIRYMLLFNLMLENGGMNFAKYRKKSAETLETICFASILWEVFKKLVNGVLDSFVAAIGANIIGQIKTTIAEEVEALLAKALRIDEQSISDDLNAEHICPAI